MNLNEPNEWMNLNEWTKRPQNQKAKPLKKPQRYNLLFSDQNVRAADVLSACSHKGLTPFWFIGITLRGDCLVSSLSQVMKGEDGNERTEGIISSSVISISFTVAL